MPRYYDPVRMRADHPTGGAVCSSSRWIGMDTNSRMRACRRGADSRMKFASGFCWEMLDRITKGFL
jgi:hypothetical protein